MTEFIKFIFSSFWIWLGFITLVAVVLKYLVDAIKAIRNTRNVKIFRFKDGRQTIEIENATNRDVADAICASSDDCDVTEGR